MVITMLEARVAPDKTGVLQDAYRQATRELDPGLVQTSLLRDLKDPGMWRIVTVWESREALDSMRSAGTPTGVLIFREAGAEPALSVFDVRAQAAA